MIHAERLNAENSNELKSHVQNLNNSSVNHIVMDLSEVKFCDSSGLSAILMANRTCKDSSGEFELCGLQPMVLKMIQIAQLEKVIRIIEK